MNTGISTILVDCDGCLTDGKKYVGEDGQRAMAAFHSRDNTAIQRLIEAGYRVIIVTASRWPGIRRYWGKYNVEVFSASEKESLPGIDWESTVGIGDDIMDAPFLRRCAWAYVPAGAHPRLLAEFSSLATSGGAGIMAEVENRIEALHISEGIKYEYNGKAY